MDVMVLLDIGRYWLTDENVNGSCSEMYVWEVGTLSMRRESVVCTEKAYWFIKSINANINKLNIYR
jgi:hypothetical protein